MFHQLHPKAMENNFIHSASLGKNEWWRYILTILTTVFTIVLTNLLIRKLLPTIKKLFPDIYFLLYDMGKIEMDFEDNLITYL